MMRLEGCLNGTFNSFKTESIADTNLSVVVTIGVFTSIGLQLDSLIINNS